MRADTFKIPPIDERSTKPGVTPPAKPTLASPAKPTLTSPAKPTVTSPADPDGLDAFNTETALERNRVADAVSHRAPKDASRAWIGMAGKALAIMLVGAAFAVGGMWAYQSRGLVSAPATLSLQTTPSGAQVIVDGKPSGATPVSLVLAPGSYHVRLVGANGRTRELDFALQAGASVVQQIEWAETPPAVPAVGTLQIQTDPPGQMISVDETSRGLSPLTVSGLSVGEHQVTVAGADGPFRRQVTIAAGETVSLVIAPNSRAASGGWLRVVSPVPLQLHANGKFVGSTATDRLMLPPGDYELEMINESLGFSSKQRTRIAAGRTSDVRVTPPNGTLSINALPWADVWVNNERVGQTPIANLSRPIGTHDVVLRHPQFGERRLRVTVSLTQTARLGVDMRQP
jgi:hypothetical protein